MARKKKDNPLPLPDIQYLIVSYICPECEYKVKRKLPYIPGDSHSTQLKSAGWCNHPYCEARHAMLYTVKENKDKSLKIKMLKFISNGELYSKRFKVVG